MPRIKRLLPTNLPTISVGEKRADNVFLLEDDTILIIEYESSPNYEDLVKYCHYGFRIFESHIKDKFHKVIIVVIYTGEVQSAPNTLDIGSIKLSFAQVFLSKFDGQKMYDDLKYKIEHNIRLEEEDIMRFIILPLTKNENRQKSIEDAIELAKEVKDETQKSFLVAGIITAAYKFIDKKYLNKIEEWISMTGFGRYLEEDKIDAVNKAVKKEREEIARNMILENVDILFIMKVTGLQKDEILDIKKEMNITEKD